MLSWFLHQRLQTPLSQGHPWPRRTRCPAGEAEGAASTTTAARERTADTRSVSFMLTRGCCLVCVSFEDLKKPEEGMGSGRNYKRRRKLRRTGRSYSDFRQD